MQSRRTLLTRILFGLATVVIGGRTASKAIAESPREWVARVLADMPRSADLVRRDDCSFVAEVQASLLDDIAAGHLEPDAQRIVDCPLCRDRIVVTAGSSG